VSLSSPVKRFTKNIVLLFCTVIVAGCATNSGGSGDAIYDPNEDRNRKVHAFNVSLDKKFVRPIATEYSSALPDVIEDSISNFASNLGQPSILVNSVLQGDLQGVSLSATRFLTNSILGVGGLFNTAEKLGLKEHDTDFGETLYKWGAEEGEYVELPLLGPATVRSTTGIIVDLLINPLSYAVSSPETYYGTLASTSAGLSARGRYTSTIDSILYESADSYAQARLIYLQNRRFSLGDEGSFLSADDPYSDPYEDPYAQ
jgi:phospholipid-binding lipoprotein MlaA